MHQLATALALAAALLTPLAPAAAKVSPPSAAGEVGGPGLALRSVKVLSLARGGPAIVDHGVVLVRDGKIEAVGPARSTPIPASYVQRDVGDMWLMPGMIELHNHIGTGLGLLINDINDMVYLTNPGLRASAGVVPRNLLLRRAVAGGVTTALFIPGSGSNMGGQGVLFKLGLDTYEEMEVRNPGSLKLAQSGNPEGWTVGVGRSFMNWNTRNTFQRGITYAKAWEAYEDGQGPEPRRNPQWDVFRDLYAKKTQVSTHTQVYQVVLMTITMVSMELGLDVYIDHGSFDGFKTAALAEEQGVYAILGPRMIARGYPPFAMDMDGQLVGMAAKYQEGGHTNIGFNTDCVDNGAFITPPQEELSLQAGMAVRYGLKIENLENVRGLTIVPAMAAGIDDRVGSLEVGKDADILVLSGDPGDPRTFVQTVYTEGKVVYDSTVDARLW